MKKDTYVISAKYVLTLRLKEDDMRENALGEQCPKHCSGSLLYSVSLVRDERGVY